MNPVSKDSLIRAFARQIFASFMNQQGNSATSSTTPFWAGDLLWTSGGKTQLRVPIDVYDDSVPVET